jgi:hypothetical protein
MVLLGLASWGRPRGGRAVAAWDGGANAPPADGPRAAAVGGDDLRLGLGRGCNRERERGSTVRREKREMRNCRCFINRLVNLNECRAALGRQ